MFNFRIKRFPWSSNLLTTRTKTMKSCCSSSNRSRKCLPTTICWRACSPLPPGRHHSLHIIWFHLWCRPLLRRWPLINSNVWIFSMLYWNSNSKPTLLSTIHLSANCSVHLSRQVLHRAWHRRTQAAPTLVNTLPVNRVKYWCPMVARHCTIMQERLQSIRLCSLWQGSLARQ